MTFHQKRSKQTEWANVIPGREAAQDIKVLGNYRETREDRFLYSCVLWCYCSEVVLSIPGGRLILCLLQFPAVFSIEAPSVTSGPLKWRGSLLVVGSKGRTLSPKRWKRSITLQNSGRQSHGVAHGNMHLKINTASTKWPFIYPLLTPCYFVFVSKNMENDDELMKKSLDEVR